MKNILNKLYYKAGITSDSKITFFTQVGSLLLIWIMTEISESSLLLFGPIFSILSVLILILLNFIAFNNLYKDFKPSFRLWEKKYLKQILDLAFTFFIVRISRIVLYSIDNIIISKLFGSQTVVPYRIAFKYLSIPTMILSIIAVPYCSVI